MFIHSSVYSVIYLRGGFECTSQGCAVLRDLAPSAEPNQPLHLWSPTTAVDNWNTITVYCKLYVGLTHEIQ